MIFMKPEPIQEKEFVQLDGIPYELQVTNKSSLCFDEIGRCIPDELIIDFLNSEYNFRKFITKLTNYLREN